MLLIWAREDGTVSNMEGDMENIRKPALKLLEISVEISVSKIDIRKPGRPVYGRRSRAGPQKNGEAIARATEDRKSYENERSTALGIVRVLKNKQKIHYYV